MDRPRMEGRVGETAGPHVSLLDDVRNLELRYSRARREEIELTVVYVGGLVEVFEVDGFLVERLLEHLERREA